MDRERSGAKGSAGPSGAGAARSGRGGTAEPDGPSAGPSRPEASTSVRGAPIERLWDAGSDLGAAPGTGAAATRGDDDASGSALSRGDGMPEVLRARYGGPIAIPLRRDRPVVIANFVSSIDGVVAVAPGGGGEISGFAEPDRFVMAILRALADAILVGAGTVRAAPTHVWTPRHVHPASARALASWRDAMGLEPSPTTIVVTGSGELDPDHPALHAGVPVVVATTAGGAARLVNTPLPPSARVEVASDGRAVDVRSLVDLAGRLGARVVLCEGGPHLFGQLVAAGQLDELFLTLAPHLLGRDGAAGRLALVEGVAFGPGQGPWARLESVHRAAELVFLRYRFG